MPITFLAPLIQCIFTQQTFVLMKTSLVFVFRRRLQDIFKTFWLRQIYSPYSYVFRRRLQDVFMKTVIFVLVIQLQDVFKTFSRRLQDVFKTSSRHLAKTFSRRPQNVFKTSCKDVFKTCSRRIIELIFLVNTFSRCLWDVFKTCLKHSRKTVIYRRICLSHTSERFMVNVQNLPEWQKFLKF